MSFLATARNNIQQPQTSLMLGIAESFSLDQKESRLIKIYTWLKNKPRTISDRYNTIVVNVSNGDCNLQRLEGLMRRMCQQLARGWSCRVFVSGLFEIDCSGGLPSSPTETSTSGSLSPSLLKRDEFQNNFRDLEGQTTPLITTSRHHGARLISGTSSSQKP